MLSFSFGLTKYQLNGNHQKVMKDKRLIAVYIDGAALQFNPKRRPRPGA